MRTAVRVVGQLGGTPGSKPWEFATDGGHFAAAGAQPVGFAPGNEALAHTIEERIDLDELNQAVSINEQLARALSDLTG